MFWSIKKSGEVFTKMKSRGFRGTSLSTYDVSFLYTTLPHNLIEEKLLDLIERAFKEFYKNEGTPCSTSSLLWSVYFSTYKF